MKKGRGKKTCTGKITHGPNEQDNLVLKTINFVRRQLPKWRDDNNRPPEQTENRLSEQLCDFLNSAKCRSEFPMASFSRERSQTSRRSVDLAASPSEGRMIGAKFHTIYQPFLVLECKRLPTPGTGREMEYVTGGESISGGIQRFKLGLHGADHTLAAMIGYVQSRNLIEWHKKINSWLRDLARGTIKDDCTWKKSEALKSFTEDKPQRTARSRSVHNRTGSKTGTTIELHHLWVEMSKKG